MAAASLQGAAVAEAECAKAHSGCGMGGAGAAVAGPLWRTRLLASVQWLWLYFRATISASSSTETSPPPKASLAGRRWARLALSFTMNGSASGRRPQDAEIDAGELVPISPPSRPTAFAG